MNMPRNRALGFGADTYLFASASGPHISWLLNALQRSGTVVPVTMSTEVLDERIAALSPQAVFLDFSAEQASKAAEVHRQLKRDWPQLPILGTGPATEAATMLTALRAGVDDFVDVAAAPDEVAATLQALVERRSAQLVETRGRTIALLGARAGMGVTTLSTNLTLLLQDLLAQASVGHKTSAVAQRRGVALLDLGLPARDGLLYMDTESSFSFVDGVHNLRRLDQTLVQTALAHHTSGAAVLPLPASLAQVREISHADSVALIKRLSAYFDFQIADLGGFSTVDFIAQTVLEADKAWVVCDQSIGGIVSTANLLRELNTRGVEPHRFSLVVNMMDLRAGLPPRDIAARLGLPLAHLLPLRRSPLLAAASQGELLARTARNDPYVQAVLGMARGLLREYADPATAVPPPESPWSAFKAQLTGKWKSAREG